MVADRNGRKTRYNALSGRTLDGVVRACIGCRHDSRQDQPTSFGGSPALVGTEWPAGAPKPPKSTC